MESESESVIVTEERIASRVTKVNITFSAKRTIRIAEDFYSFDSGQSWTLENGDVGFSDVEAHKIVLEHSPILMKKVMFDLMVAGVLPRDKFLKFKERVTKAYGGKSDTDRREDTGNIPGTEDTGSSSDPKPSDGP